MSPRACLVGLFVSLAVTPVLARTPDCNSLPGQQVVPIGKASSDASDWFSRLLIRGEDRPQPKVEVSGTNPYHERLENGWVFSLIPQPHGWSIRLFDRPDGIDLTQLTPPLHPADTNPRELSGWHFRNRTNSAANGGDVNAPQHLRLFSFASALAGTGGYKPEPGGSVTALQEDGRGWLFIHDLGLADLEPGKRARANYLQFSACLSWPQSEAETDGHAAQSSRHHDEQQPAFPPDCGLDLQRFRLEATISPAQWVLDVDGDGAHDQLAQVTDRASGAHDLVLCRAGASLHHLSSLNIYTDVGQGFAAMERWSVVPKTFASIGTPGGDTTWPAADGDVIVLERIEKSMHLVFMQDGRLTASTVYRLVEP